MTTPPALQDLLDDLRKVLDQAKTAQGSIQQLRSNKKEAEVAKRRHDALTSLQTMQAAMAKLQEQIKETEPQLDDAAEQKQPPVDEQRQEYEKKASQQGFGLIETRKLSPEQQEALYELKASRMGAMRSQNQALKKELQLNQRKKRLLDVRYASTQAYSGSETLRAAHALEAKLRGAQLKIKGLEDELRKSQQTVLYYQEMHSSKEHGSDAGPSSGNRQDQPSKSAPRLKPAPLREQSFIGPNTNVNDVVRKNECLLEENEVQRREIHRLKQDNAVLVRLAKTASTDKNAVFSRLGTSESAREDLQKRYFKLKKENSQLSRSFTSQAAKWIDVKKQEQHNESHERWGEIYPVAPHGARDRFQEHPQKENTSLPKQMYPVESYGGTSTA